MSDMTPQVVPTENESLPLTPGVAYPTSPSADWFLQQLVDYSNIYGIGTPITVQVGGMMICGEIIPASVYFDEFAAEFKRGFTQSPELGDTFFDLVVSYKKLLVQPEEGEDVPPPNYIHLRNAKVFTVGNVQNAVNVALWRGRISEVGGFFLGTVSVT